MLAVLAHTMPLLILTLSSPLFSHACPSLHACACAHAYVQIQACEGQRTSTSLSEMLNDLGIGLRPLGLYTCCSYLLVHLRDLSFIFNGIQTFFLCQAWHPGRLLTLGIDVFLGIRPHWLVVFLAIASSLGAYKNLSAQVIGVVHEQLNITLGSQKYRFQFLLNQQPCIVL